MNERLNRRAALSRMTAAAAATWCVAGHVGNASVTAPGRTSWPSFRNGPTQRGLAGSQLAQQPKPKWEFKSKDGWVAASAIVGDHVYAPALEGYLYCLDRQTGQVRWKYRSIGETDENTFAPGFKAAPLVTKSAVYVGDEDGVLHAVDRETGSALWKFATGAEIAGGVAVYENNLLLASHDSVLYCLGEQGNEIWKFETNDMINCSPAVAEHFTFLSGCDQMLRVIDLRNGKEVRQVEMSSPLIASPAIVDEMLYVGAHAGDFVAVNWKSGEVVWRYEGKRQMPYHASAAVTDDLVLVGNHDKLMHAIDRKTGDARWTFTTRARIDSSAAVVGDRLFFGSGDGNLYGLQISDGKEVWKFNAGKPVSCGIAVGEGCLVAGEDDRNGALRCFS